MKEQVTIPTTNKIKMAHEIRLKAIAESKGKEYPCVTFNTTAGECMRIWIGGDIKIGTPVEFIVGGTRMKSVYNGYVDLIGKITIAGNQHEKVRLYVTRNIIKQFRSYDGNTPTDKH